MKRLFLITIVFLICVINASFADNAGNNSTSGLNETIMVVANASASYYIKQDTYACTTETAFDEMIRACTRKDQKAIERLAAQGTLALLKKGTEIDLIKTGLGKCRVQAISGPYRGTYFYVVTEHVGRR